MEDVGRPPHVLTAHAAGLVGCTGCGKVHRLGAGTCTRCGATLHPATPANLQRVWAWLMAGIVAFIPANIFPMLKTTTFGRTTENTIFGGVVDLISHGNYGIATIVFVASIVIPLFKFATIAYLALTVTKGGRLPMHQRHVLFGVVEFIGRWSMIDVFVVAILASLVQLDFTASINPGIAAVSFALSVAFTMIAAISFDERLIWGGPNEEAQ